MIGLPGAAQAQTLLPPAPAPRLSQAPHPPPEMQQAGRLERIAQVGGAVMDVAVEGQRAYIGKGMRLVILDLTQPEAMPILGASQELPDIIQGVAAAGQYVYLAAGGAGLRIFNVHKPDTPVQLGSLNTWANSVTLYEKDDKRYACLTDGDLRLVDVSDPENPLEIGQVLTPGYAANAAVMGDFAYVADGTKGLQVVDISQPAQPQLLGNLVLPGYAYGVVVWRDETSGKTYAYLANGSDGGLRLVDVSDPAMPLETALILEKIDARDLALHEQRLLAAGGEAGLLIFDLSRPEAPIMLGRYDTNGYALGVTAAGASAFVADGSGLLSIDFTDETDPKLTASHDVLGAAYRVALAGQMVEGAERTYAYVADYYSGMYVLDVTNKTLRPTVTGFYDAPGYANSLSVIQPPVTGDPSVMEQMTFTPGQRFVLLAGAKTGVRLVDVSSPYFPSQIGSINQGEVFDDPALTVEVQTSGVMGQEAAPGARRLAYLAEGFNGGLRILDLSDARQPHEAGYFKAGEGVYGAAIRQVYQRSGDGGGLRAAAGEFSSGIRTIAYLAAGSEGVRVADVSDPENPFELGVVDTPGSARALALQGERLFVADGQNSGIRIFDVKEAAQPLEVGHYTSEGEAVNLAVSVEQVVLADGSAGVRIVDVSDPAAPIETASIRLPGFTNSVAVWEDMVYSADRAAGLSVLQYLPARPLTYQVSSTADQPDATPGDGQCATLAGECTLRAAIQEANANPGLDTIEVPSGAYILTYAGAEEEASQRGDLDIRDSLIVRGAGAETTVIDGAGLERVFHVAGSRVWVDISGVTVQNGLGGINVQNAALFSLRDSIVTRNHGYGVWGSQSNISLEHCLVSENIDESYVGGIGSSLGSLQIRHSSIVRNSGSDGGIYADGDFAMFDSTVSGNSGLGGAGGLRLGGKAQIVGATIADNEGAITGGIAVDDGANATIGHTIVADNRAAQSADCSGKIHSQGYNLIGNPTGFVLERGSGDQIGVQAALAALTAMDGIRFVHALLPGSPALDGGNPGGCPQGGGNDPSPDNRDRPRSPIDGNLDGNAVCDIGAMEFNPETVSVQ